MPELPEVEVVRRGLVDHLLGASFDSVSVFHPRAVRGQPGGVPELQNFLDASTVDSINRRGKFLWLALDSARALRVHLGMSGQMLLSHPGVVDEDPHLRIRALLHAGDKDWNLDFVDQRTFGQWQVVETQSDPFSEFLSIPVTIAHIAQDPLEDTFDIVATARAIRAKRTEIKRALLDQSVVSGIGNIYADECLWMAGISPTRRTTQLRQNEAVAVLETAQKVMNKALAAGGTSFDSLYVNVNGQSGYFSRSLHVYGREGEPCDRCGEPIVRVKWTNRSSHFCPECQK